MLFHITQKHDPQDCPYGKGGSPSLFDRDASGITLRGFWLAFRSTRSTSSSRRTTSTPSTHS